MQKQYLGNKREENIYTTLPKIKKAKTHVINKKGRFLPPTGSTIGLNNQTCFVGWL